MAESHLACPDCETPVDPGRVQIAGFDRPVQCPGCGEVFMPWMLRVVHGLHSFLAGDFPVTFATPYVFVPLNGSIQSALNALTNGGTVWLEPGTYTLVNTLYLSHPGLTLKGAGDGATVLYMAARNTDIVVIENGSCTIEDLSIFGTVGGNVNGAGAAGTGRGVVIAQPDSTHNFANPSYLTLTGRDTCSEPTLRRVTITNTASWCVYDTGTKYPAAGVNWTNWTDPLSNSGKALSIFLTLETVNVAFWASGGGLFIGSAASTPRISGFKTNGYSYGTYTQVTGAGPKPNNDLGSVFIYNVFGGILNDLYLQSPSAGGILPDKDACMLSFLNCVSMTITGPKFEILNAGLTCADSNNGTGGREFFFITACNSQNIRFINPNFQSRLNDGGSTLSNWGLKILRTSDQPSSVGVTFEGGIAFHGRTTLGGDTGARVLGEPVTWDRNDFMFGGTEASTQNAQIIIEDFFVANSTTGKHREPTFPVEAFTVVNCTTAGVPTTALSTTTGDFSAVNRGDTVSGSGVTAGTRVQYVTSTTTIVLDQNATVSGGTTLTFTPPAASVVGRPHFHIRNRRGFRLGSWSTCDLTGAGNADDFFARTTLSQNLRSGIMGYVTSGDENEGLWITESVNALPRHVPFYRVAASLQPNPATGDLSFKTGDQSLYTYNGTTAAWETYVKNQAGGAADAAISLLGSLAVDMKTAASTTIFTTAASRKTRITHVVVRDPTATLAGGTNYSFTSWRSGIDLSGMTGGATQYRVLNATDNTNFTEISASTAFQITVTTGATNPVTATIDVFGYTTT